MHEPGTTSTTSLRVIFSGRRGRLLAALLLAEFAGAVQGIAYATVLPLAAQELDGAALYGATLSAGLLTGVVVLAAGPGVTARLPPRQNLALATGLFVAGVVLSACAPAMGWLLAGGILRGIAGGLLAAFGLSAIGGLFEDDVRPRVLSLFTLVWLLPSLAGPPVNAAITVWLGWRWAMAWPVLVVIAARLLMSRDTGLIPAPSEEKETSLGTGLLVAAGLALASAATTRGGWGIPLLVAGLLLAVVAGTRVMVRATADSRRRTTVVLAYACLAAAFFGGDGLIPLAIVEGLGRGVVASAVGLGAGLVAWSITGLLPATAGRRPDPAKVGTVLVVAALLTEAFAQTGLVGSTPALVLAVAAWGVAGFGIGIAYVQLSAQAFDSLAPERVAAVAGAVAFAETASVVVGSLLGAGSYSLATGLHVGASTGISVGFLLVAAVGAVGAVLAARR
ncbi:MFS transporter [Petropleomorpha daqingensis]|uniref:MFS family permease n=1 Tax=Petropleomorpha daqingensis TaxID=2026353 RepID=A0A853CIC3_9ACTN|nr:MFS transporter [Petropleomorpha daqingensis]NYJ06028.1 MFS family permease [Petropleomorpha daqingensis]